MSCFQGLYPNIQSCTSTIQLSRVSLKLCADCPTSFMFLKGVSLLFSLFLFPRVSPWLFVFPCFLELCLDCSAYLCLKELHLDCSTFPCFFRVAPWLSSLIYYFLESCLDYPTFPCLFRSTPWLFSLLYVFIESRLEYSTFPCFFRAMLWLSNLLYVSLKLYPDCSTLFLQIIPWLFDLSIVV